MHVTVHGIISIVLLAWDYDGVVSGSARNPQCHGIVKGKTQMRPHQKSIKRGRKVNSSRAPGATAAWGSLIGLPRQLPAPDKALTIIPTIRALF